MINPYAIMSLIPGIACLFLSMYVININRKKNENRIFFLLLLTLAVWLLAEFVYRQLTVAAEASFWIKIRAFISPYTIAFLFHFFLVYTKHEEIVKRKIILFLIYAPAFLISLIEVTTELITGPPLMEPWGFTYYIPDNIFNISSLVWTSIVGILSLIIVFRYSSTAKEKNERIQAGYMTIGLTIPLAVGVTTEIVMPFFFNTRIVELFSLSCMAFCIFVVYAMWKYNLFPITLESATKNILSSISDSVLLINTNGTISYTNKAAQKLLGYTEEQLLNYGTEILSKDSGISFNELASTLDRSALEDAEFVVRKKDGTSIIVSLSGNAMLGNDNKIVGYVIICRDITKRKSNDDELKRKSDELERFNRLAVGRELKIVELKKKIDELEHLLGRVNKGSKDDKTP